MNTRERVFIGLDLSRYFLDTIPMVRSTIVDKRGFIKWVSGKKLHLTLSFLGQIESSQIESLNKKLNIISDFDSFNITVNGTGSFAYEGTPRVLWLGINEGKVELNKIQTKIDSIATPYKDNNKKEDFIPHITIGRIKPGKNFDLSTFSNAVYSDIKIPIKTVYLFKSQLLEHGVEYSIISEYPLK